MKLTQAIDLEQITKQTIEVVNQAGAFIKQEAAAFDRSVTEYKDTNNLVSYVDKEAEKILVSGLQKILPQAGFITEEGTTDQTENAEGLYWIIDPLDGTANFIHSLPVYCVSVGLVQNKQPIAGVIQHLGTGELFYGWHNGGAYLELNNTKTKLQVSPAKTLGESLLATGFPYYKFEKQENYLEILKELMQSCHGLRRMGAAAIDLAYVAAGRFEAFYEYNLQSWDMAAGTLLVIEAGGTVTDFSGNQNWLFGGDIVAGCSAHKELLETIQKYWK